MLNLIICVFLCLFIIFALLLVSFITTKKLKSDREKLSPFECGFMPSTPPHNYFSLRFFLIAIIFLIFDVELILIFPYILSSGKFGSNASVVLCVFVIFLLLGVEYENNQGVLNWAN